jgi:hypothetical protein
MDYPGLLNSLLEKFPARALLAAIGATGLVVLLPPNGALQSALEPLHLYRAWIWLATIFALCLFGALLIGDLWGIGRAVWIERKRRQRAIHRLEHLEFDERDLLAKLVLRGERTCNADAPGGGVVGAGYRLCEAGIMRQNRIRELQVDEWTWRYLQEHRDLVIAPEDDPLARPR